MKRSRRGVEDEKAEEDVEDDNDEELDLDQEDDGDDDEGKTRKPADLSKDFFQVIENGADANNDDGDRVDYDDLIMPATLAQGTNDERPSNTSARSNSKKKAKTLLELAQGPNRDAATNMIEDSVYAMAIVCNFVSFR